MISVDNRNVLRMKDRDLLNRMTEVENSNPTGTVIVEPSKTAHPTLKIALNGRMQYVHSKYDPEKDAERLIGKFKGDKVKHVLFVGAGLGYHIRMFTVAHPSTKFSIYEPDEEVLLAFLSHAKLDKLPLQNLISIFTGTDSDNIKNRIQQLLQTSKGMLQIITLPVYQKIYGIQIATITKQIVDSLKGKRTALTVNLSFQKRWTANSIKNFPMVLKTPNILHDIEQGVFKGKTAIIVAAGPSLNEEFENLRYIKENGLAYIFSVGSAINALLEHEIYPDATCTYDPQGTNANVIKIIKDKEITNIPLIFGSSVGFETLDNYPGHMLHMLVSQDTIAPAFLGRNLVTDIDYVNDAPSIAVVTYQLLSQLGCEKIILVGQNLAYVGEDHYASGIDYGSGAKASESALTNALVTKDVYGNDVKTSESFNSMRRQLELYIKSRSHIKTINTTKGGAAIDGTTFIPLEQIIKEELTTRIVVENWYKVNNTYDFEKVHENILIIDKAQKEIDKLLKHAMSILEQLNGHIEKRNFMNIEVLYGKFDVSFEGLKENHFYRSFIEPMLRVQNERLAEKISSVRYERNEYRKGEAVVGAFLIFLHEVSAHHNLTTELYEEMKTEIKS